MPRSIGLIYCGFLFILLFVGRYAIKELISFLGRSGLPVRDGASKAILIYGASSTGVRLSQSLQKNSRYTLCGFVDDDPTLWDRMAGGTRIFSPDCLPELIRSKAISEVMLALPNATRTQRLHAVSRIANLRVEIKTIPASEEIASGRFRVTDIRPIEVNDLLRRDPIQPLTEELIERSVDGCSIMVTGAGGSIGSEICRQIMSGSPAKLVLLDHSEYAVYSIGQELRELLRERGGANPPEIVPIIGSILNEKLVRNVIRSEQIDTVYHAAAYKHVPLLERNEIGGLENNVFGTFTLAAAATEAGISRFIMISTDKAVRPRNLMGASKRVAELIVQACAKDNADTRFGIVRFGNVLDSSGSVVQLFRKQIMKGGPVTVTHRDVTRFFMSIPEATQLVLQASAMAERGEVFVLDMGEPVRIDDLARNMIRLSGLTVRDDDNPDGDIELTYVGLRPGEKLYEELFIGESAVPTEHPRIRKAIERSIPPEELRLFLDRLRAAIADRDAAAARTVLREIIEPDTCGVNREAEVSGIIG